MAIEFRCRQCSRLLRTPDDSVGKPAQCPECGGLTTVPRTSEVGFGGGRPALGDFDQPHDPYGLTGDPYKPAGYRHPEIDPAAGEARRADSAADPHHRPRSDNPYEAPSLAPEYYPPDAARAAQRASAPALALIIVASIDLGLSVLGGLLMVVLMAAPGIQANDVFGMGWNAGGAVVSVAINILIIIGMINMRRLNNYGLAMTAAILSLLPCFHCCVFKLPFAIWAIVVLNEVRPSFRS